jgi:hypothetical protein
MQFEMASHYVTFPSNMVVVQNGLRQLIVLSDFGACTS